MFCSIMACVVLVVLSAHCSFIWIKMTIKILLEFAEWEQNTKEMAKVRYQAVNELESELFRSAWKMSSEVCHLTFFFFFSSLIRRIAVCLVSLEQFFMCFQDLKLLMEWFCHYLCFTFLDFYQPVLASKSRLFWVEKKKPQTHFIVIKTRWDSKACVLR